MSSTETKTLSLPSHVFMCGDTVQVRHELENRPKMVVFKKVMSNVDEREKRKLDQLLCYWFDRNHVFQTQSFDYRDLEVIKRAQ